MVCLKGVAADEARFERGAARRWLRALALLERRNARRADRVIVPSGYSARVAAEAYSLPPERLRVVSEGIDLDFWLAREPRPHGPDRPEAAAGARILSVARQYPRKNTAALLRALPGVLRRVPEARLAIVGGGPELPSLRRLASKLQLSDHVRFLGELPTSEAVRRAYREADVFCLPSLQEGFGIAFLEAMASGLPVVGPRVGAVPEVVPHGEAGLLVDPRRPEDLAGALIEVLLRPDLRARLGRAGLRRVRRYGWPEVAGRFLEAALSD